MVEPYYQDDHVTIYHCDSAQNSSLWGNADVLVTDPPYGMSYASGWNDRRIANDDSPQIRDDVLAMWVDRPALVFGRWSVPHPKDTKMCLTWDKGDWPGMGDLALPWGPSTEEIYVLGSGFVGKRGSSVLRFDRLTGNIDHPNEKPVPLMRRLLSHCPAEWVVADPFMGSGATLRAAKDLGRKAIGVELDERYCELAASRCAQEVLAF